MTHTTVFVISDDGRIKTRRLGDIDVMFHGKFYITIQGHDYALKHHPIYSSNTDTIYLVCAELKEGEVINNYSELDALLVSDPEKIAKYVGGDGKKKYLKYDWEYKPYIECDDDHIEFLVESSEVSDDAKEMAKEAGLSASIYLQETGNKSVWKDGSPIYRAD